MRPSLRLLVRIPHLSAYTSQPVTVATVPCCAVSTTRPPLHSYYSGTKPRARYEWSGGIFLRYVRRAGLALLRDALKHAVNRTKIVRSRPTVARPRVRCRQTQHKTPPNQTRIEMRVWSGGGAHNAKKSPTPRIPVSRLSARVVCVEWGAKERALSQRREGDPGGNRTRLKATRPDHVHVRVARSGLSIMHG